MSDLVVVKHNELIRSSFTLSVVESRIVLLCIAKIDSTGELSHTTKFTIHASEIADIIGIEKDGGFYDGLKEATNSLANRWVELAQPSEVTSEFRTRWIHAVNYIDSEATVELYFAHFIIPFLSELSKNFTKYKVGNVLSFKSPYSIRFYEILKSWVNLGHKQIDADWIRNTLQLSKAYLRASNLTEKVVKPAVEEINLHSDLRVTYEAVLKGRRLIGYSFTFKNKQKVISSKTKKAPTVKPAGAPDNLNHFANLRKQFGDKAPIPKEFEEQLKALGLW
jgi:plasmid replication initiation protein